MPVSDWKDTYGVESDGKGLTMNFVTQGPYSHNVGGRTYAAAAPSAATTRQASAPKVSSRFAGARGATRWRHAPHECHIRPY